MKDFDTFTKTWRKYVEQNFSSTTIDEEDWILLFAQKNPIAGINFGRMDDTTNTPKGLKNFNEQKSVKDNWDAIRDEINKIYNNNQNLKQKLESLHQKIQTFITQGNGRIRTVAINRILTTFFPDVLLTIPNNEDVKILIKLLNIENEKLNLQESSSWVENSINVKKIMDNYFSNDTHWEKYKELEKKWFCLILLEKNHNLILTGAPGTGKTYKAKEISKKMKAKMEFVQFHPSYDYTDFVEGLRPTSSNTFIRQDGIFKTICKDAISSIQQGKNEKFVIIIDEINRGEISKIFGELFFSIDPDYRVKKGDIPQSITNKNDVKDFAIQTQYQNLINDPKDCFSYGFFVPENVYIIGTMNDIDRSVESMDFAMRRRFAFDEFHASEHLGMLQNITNDNDRVLAKIKMQALNDAIVNEKIGNLPQAYQIGGSYFIHINKYLNEDTKWEMLWNYHLKGFLFEYFRGKPNAQEILKDLKNVYDKAK